MADISLTFPDVDADGDLVFSGVEDGNPLGLLAMTEPGRIARLVYADDSPHVHGSLAIAGSWQQAVISAQVNLKGATQADLNAKKARMFAALERFRYPVIQSANGVTSSWICDMGSASPDEMNVNDLEDFEAVFSLSIPCYPIPGA